MTRPERALMLFFLALYLLTFSGQMYSQDGRELWRVTCSLARPPLFGSQYGIVPSAIGLGFYGLGRSSQYLGLVPAEEPGNSPSMVFFGSMQNAVVSAAVVTLFFLGARQFYSPRKSLILALALGLTTLVWPYSKYDFYSPTATALLLGAFLLLTSWRRDGQPGRALLAGLVLGLMFNTRLDTLAIVPGALGYLWWSGRPDDDRRLGVARFLLGFLPCLVFAGWFNYVRFGSLFADPRLAQESFSTPLLYGLFGYLFSPGRSIFYYSPLLILGLLGWRCWWRDHRRELLLIAYLTVVYFLLYAQWCNWSANWCYGPRYFLKLVPFLLLTAGSLIGRGRTLANAAFIVLGLLGLALQMTAVSVDFNDGLNEQLGIVGIDNDASFLDPMLSHPVWNLGIIDGRGLIPKLYDYGWLNLARFHLPRGWVVIPLGLALLLGWSAVRLLPHLAGTFPWFHGAVALALVALLVIGVSVNTGKNLALVATADGVPYAELATRNVNFVDYFGQWRRLWQLKPGSVLEWRGKLDCPVGGVGYRFGLMTHGEETELWLDDTCVLQMHPRGTKFQMVALELLKGEHNLRVRYRLPLDAAEPARVTLYWHLPYTSLGVIYGEHFRPPDPAR